MSNEYIMNSKQTRILFHILLIIGAFWMLLPFLWMISTALKTQLEALRFPPTVFPAQFMFINFIEAFRQVDFSRYFINTIIMTGATTLLVF